MIVADANLIAYLVIDGPYTKAARHVYENDADWVAPPLWRSEFLNLLATTIRAGKLTERDGRSAWRTACALIAIEQEPPASLVLRLATRNRVSAYDAEYVALAWILKSRLVTADRKLAKAFPKHAALLSRQATGGKP